MYTGAPQLGSTGGNAILHECCMFCDGALWEKSNSSYRGSLWGRRKRFDGIKRLDSDGERFCLSAIILLRWISLGGERMFTGGWVGACLVLMERMRTERWKDRHGWVEVLKRQMGRLKKWCVIWRRQDMTYNLAFSLARGQVKREGCVTTC